MLQDAPQTAHLFTLLMSSQVTYELECCAAVPVSRMCMQM